MNTPLMHPRTKLQLQAYLKNPTHGLLLCGDEGIGKTHLATWLADELKTPLSIIEKEEKLSSISIDQIRGLYQQTKTGRPQVILIKDAHHMGREAQNAFLKLLEEPPENTLFILTAPSPKTLLPTIQSRTQALSVIAPKKQEVFAFFQDQYPGRPEELTQLIRIVDGLPGKIGRAIRDREYAEKTLEAMQQAKVFYTAKPYERHLMLISNNYEKSFNLLLLCNLATIITALIMNKATDVKVLKKLSRQAKMLEQIKHALINTAGSPKIHLTKLAEEL